MQIQKMYVEDCKFRIGEGLLMNVKDCNSEEEENRRSCLFIKKMVLTLLK
jgi:hypothetical protein